MTVVKLNYLKILSQVNSLITNNNIRSVVLETENDRERETERERNISILTILHVSFLVSNMALPIRVFVTIMILANKKD